MNKGQIYNFVYITTNILNTKQYIGDHSCDNLEKDNYLGSGIYFKRAVNEYGKENFKRKELEFFTTKQEAFNAQEKYIKEYNTLSPNGYNISPKGGHNVKGCCSEETKQKLSKSNKISCAAEKNGMYGKKHSKETKKMWSEKRKGLKHKEESKQKMSASRKGVKFSKERCEIMSKAHTGKGNSMFGKYGKDNPNFGSKRSQESRDKMKGRVKSEKEIQIIKETNERMKKICPYCNKLIDHRNYTRWHGEKCKHKIKTNND